MEQKQILKQILDFNHATFNNSFNAVVMMQEQFERVAKTAFTQATWLPEEGRKAVDAWVNNYKTGRDQFKTYVDDSYAKIENFLGA